jgi:hypothetical protein
LYHCGALTSVALVAALDPPQVVVAHSERGAISIVTHISSLGLKFQIICALSAV